MKMIYLKADGRWFRIRRLDARNMTVDEYRQTGKGDDVRTDWVGGTSYFQKPQDAVMWVYDKACMGLADEGEELSLQAAAERMSMTRMELERQLQGREL